MTNDKGLEIAFITAFPPGTQSLTEYGFHMVREFAANPDVAHVHVLADVLPKAAPELDLGPKVTVHRVWRFNTLSCLPAILGKLRQLRPDGALFNLQTATFGDRELTAGLGLLTPMVARWLACPTGVLAHNWLVGVDLEHTILKGQRVRQMIVKTGGAVITRAMMSASYVTTTLQSYVDALKPRYPRADLTLVPHGTFDTVEREWIPLATRPHQIVTMGKFGTYKKLETLIAAFGMLRQDPAFADYKLVIGGSDHPNTPGYFDGLARKHAGDTSIVFHGYVAEDDIARFFETAQLSVFDYESTTGSSGVLHQTASYGTLPVFPEIGDFVDVARDEGIAGYNYLPGDADDMADAMRRALSDMDAAETRARANRDASLDMPLSKVVAFHIDKFRALSN